MSRTLPATTDFMAETAHEGISSFGVRLRELRERAGFTQNSLAHAADAPVSSINKIESGERGVPEYRTVEAIMDALSTRIGDDARSLAAAALEDIKTAQARVLARYARLQEHEFEGARERLTDRFAERALGRIAR